MKNNKAVKTEETANKNLRNLDASSIDDLGKDISETDVLEILVDKPTHKPIFQPTSQKPSKEPVLPQPSTGAPIDSTLKPESQPTSQKPSKKPFSAQPSTGAPIDPTLKPEFQPTSQKPSRKPVLPQPTSQKPVVQIPVAQITDNPLFDFQSENPTGINLPYPTVQSITGIPIGDIFTPTANAGSITPSIYQNEVTAGKKTFWNNTSIAIAAAVGGVIFVAGAATYMFRDKTKKNTQRPKPRVYEMASEEKRAEFSGSNGFEPMKVDVEEVPKTPRKVHEIKYDSPTKTKSRVVEDDESLELGASDHDNSQHTKYLSLELSDHDNSQQPTHEVYNPNISPLSAALNHSPQKVNDPRPSSPVSKFSGAELNR